MDSSRHVRGLTPMIRIVVFGCAELGAEVASCFFRNQLRERKQSDELVLKLVFFFRSC